MRWQDCLLAEAEAIVGNYKGKLELHVTERIGEVSVSVLAGKRHDFIIKKIDLQDIED